MKHQTNTPNFALTKDTPTEIENIQIDLLRKAGAAKRLNIALSLSRNMVELSRRALKRANPQLDPFELGILFIDNCYGKELADNVRKYRAAKKHNVFK